MDRDGKKKKKKAPGFKMCEVATISSSLDIIVKETNFPAEYPQVPNQNQRISSKPVEVNHPAVSSGKLNQVGAVMLFGVPIVSLVMDGKERLCLAQISSTLLKEFSYNEIHNRRVALGITCIQCTPVQLEILRRAGAMPVTSRRCGMITRREAERLCQSFLGDHAPPQLPENFAFEVYHECAWGCRGAFVPSRYNSSRAKCIRCSFCQLFFSPNKFIFHSHRLPESRYVQPDAANFNSWRRHLKLCGDPPEEDSVLSAPQLQLKEVALSHKSADNGMPTAQIVHAWEDVKAMFNGGTRKRLLAAHTVVPISAPSQVKRSSHSMALKLSSSPHHAAQGNGNNSSSRAATPQSRQSAFHQSHSGLSSHTQHPSDSIGSTAPGFMSPISGITVSAPLLSPASIWNPGISPASGRQFPMGNPMPSLPLSIHPLSIPWLRRPLFPFSHPFGPTCKFLGESGALSQEAPGNSSSGTAINTIRPGSSAFKPVGQQRSPSQDHLFTTWLTSAGLHGNLPEDLSLNSGNSSNNSSCSPVLAHAPSLESDRKRKSSGGNANGCLKPCQSGGDKRSTYREVVNSRSGSKELSCKEAEEVVSSSSSRSGSPQMFQVESDGGDRKVKRSGEDSASDEENVDIESTDEFWRGESEEAVSRMSVWEMESVRQERKRALDVGDEQEVDVDDDEVDSLVRDVDSTQNRSSHHQPNPSAAGHHLKRKKRLWDFDARCNHLD